MFWVVGLLIGVIATWAFANTAVNTYQPRMMSMMGFRSFERVNNNIDQHFIEQMIPHHEDAIIMANIALERSEHNEIKDLSQNIIKAQTAENTQMRDWYKNWFGTEVPDTFAGTNHAMGSGMMHGGMLGSFSDVTNLETAQDFDKEFIDKMIPHHQMAIMMAQMLQYSTSRSEMKQLADDIIKTQTDEINQMRGWYNQWYK